MKEFLSLIIGNQSVAMFFALHFFAYIGVFINLLVHASNRDQNSPNTPREFTFKFLFWDNWKRIAAVVLILYVTIRFAGQLYDVNTSNRELYLFISLLVGVGFDRLVQFWKEKSKLLKVRKQ